MDLVNYKKQSKPRSKGASALKSKHSTSSTPSLHTSKGSKSSLIKHEEPPAIQEDKEEAAKTVADKMEEEVAAEAKSRVRKEEKKDTEKIIIIKYILISMQARLVTTF